MYFKILLIPDRVVLGFEQTRVPEREWHRPGLIAVSEFANEQIHELYHLRCLGRRCVSLEWPLRFEHSGTPPMRRRRDVSYASKRISSHGGISIYFPTTIPTSIPPRYSFRSLRCVKLSPRRPDGHLNSTALRGICCERLVCKGSREIWYSPITKRNFPVPVGIASRHIANALR